MKRSKVLVLFAMLVMLLMGSMLTVYAKSADDDYKDDASTDLRNYYDNLKIVYDLSDDAIKKMDKLYSSAIKYMDDNSMSETAVDTYASQIKSYLDKVATEDTDPTSTKEFLMLSNEVPVTSARYGEDTYMVVSLVNMGMVDLYDIVLKPEVSNKVDEWPFEINQAYDAQTIQMSPASDTVEEAYQNRMDLGWNFKVRDDVKTGYYPVKFKATYYVNKNLEEADITAYINITGRPENGDLVVDANEKVSQPRIIVTGFTTTPAEVYAGDTFTLNITLQNTSKKETVGNVLFNLEATVEGTDSIASYEAFLPVSGSSSIYTDSIAPGADYQMSIEMEAKADLAQKPYVLKVNMVYEDSKRNEYKDVASVSVPIKQELKLDTGTVDVLPNSIAVGEESNIVFDIYNTGKTTLYNVKVTYKSDVIESGITYLGNILPGQTGNVDSTVTGMADDGGAGIIQAEISYEDERGNVFTMEKDITLSVYEENYEDMTQDYTYDDTEMMDTTPKFPWGLVIVGVIVVGAGAGIVVVVFRKKAKKKKEEQELHDDLE